MPLTELLRFEAVMPSVRAQSKKHLLEVVAAHAARMTGLAERVIFDSLLQRERLGSTGIGNGIAIPHCKFEGIDRLIGLFARLEKPIDFESLDGAPVDLAFILLAPEGAGADHLKGLSRVARLLRDPATTAKLRSSREADVIYALLTQDPENAKAA